MTRALVLPITLSLAAAAAHAQVTVTVDTTEDVVDFGGGQRIVDLPGPDGLTSFREALIATNNEAGPQTVDFAIPQSRWFLVNDYALLKLEQGVFLVSDDATTIDFSTQTAFTGNTNPNGMEVGIYGLQPNGWGTPAIIIQASDCVVRGLGPVSLRGSSVAIWSGDRNRVVGSVTLGVEIDPYPGTSSFNVIGGTEAGEGNVLEFVQLLCGADDNLVIGNTAQTVSVVGSQYCTSTNQYPRRNRIGGPTAPERNVLNGAGSYSSEGFPSGQNVHVYWAQDTLVEGNYVGVTVGGLARVPQIAPSGVEVADSIDTTVRGNLIAGMRVVGINHYAGQVFGRAISIGAINADNLGTVVEGNRIGTDATGTNPLTTRNGIEVGQVVGSRVPRDTRIGGTGPGQGNTVAFVQETGIAVLGNITDAEVSGNSIHSSGLLGIDLGTFFGGINGVTPNDPLDADTGGGNEYQNFPVVDDAVLVGTGLRVRGTLHSRPLGTYRVELFANTVCDPTDFGEGETFLGFTTVTTDESGNGSFDLVLGAGPGSVGSYVTATATDLVTSATSEFGRCAPVRTRSDDLLRWLGR